jgi:hypothetical protein
VTKTIREFIRRSARLWVGPCALALCGCSEGADDRVGVSVPPGPAYIVSTSVSSGDDVQGFLVPVSSIAAGDTFGLDGAIEIPESTVSAPRADGVFYTAAMGEPRITRWQLGEDGRLVEGVSLSFGGLGVSRADVSAELFYSDEKAYFHDDASRQIVIWNPRAMSIIGTIPLDLDLPDAPALVPWLTLLVRPDRVFAVASWEEDFDADWSRFGDRVRIVSIDPATDSVVESVDEPRCNYLLWAFSATDGTAYFSPLSYYAPIRSMLGAAAGIDNCSLRIVPPATTFDAGYSVDLDALAGGRPTGSLFLVNDQVAFIRVWHSELVSLLASDKSNWQDVLNEPGFQWWRWSIGSPAAELIPGQTPAASEATGLYRIGDRKFIPRVNEDYSATTLDELDPAGELRPTLSGPGNIWGVARIR